MTATLPPPHTPQAYLNPELLTAEELQAYLRLMRETHRRRAEAHRQQGKILGLLKRIEKIPDPVNEADVWQFLDQCLVTWKVENLDSALDAVIVLMWSLSGPWTTPTAAVEAAAYAMRRQPKDGQTSANFNKQNPDDAVVLPSQRPIKDTKNQAKRLRAFLKFHRANGRLFTVTFDDPNGRAKVTNASKWADAHWLQSLPRNRNRELRAFEAMHHLPITEADVREARCSWVKRVLGVPVLRRPDGRFTLLGPYYREIENQAYHRRQQRPDDPDPILFPATMHYWENRHRPEEPMSHMQQRTRLGRVFNLKKISPESLLKLGKANAVADGAPVDYLIQSLGVTSEPAISKLEGFHRQVKHGIKMGTAKGLGDPRNGKVPVGKALCFSCGTIQDVSRTMCVTEDCDGELKAHFTKVDHAKWLAHRALDTILETRREAEDGRAQRYTDTFGGDADGDTA